jgi:hypothetical protein
MIRKLLRGWSSNKIKDVDFYWDPRLNSGDYKSFAYRSSFVKNRQGNLQFSFTYIVEHGIYDGQFNGFVNVQDGMRIYPSIKLVPKAYDLNYSKISSYLKGFLKDPSFKK